MSHEFAEAVREVAEQAHHRINTAVGRGESYSELEDALSMMDAVVSELRSALEDGEDLRGEVYERAESVRESLDPDRDDEGMDRHDADSPLEEQYENAEFAADGEFENMSADEIL